MRRDNFGSTGCPPVLFGSLAEKNFVGKLLTNADKLAALRKTEIRIAELYTKASATESAKDLPARVRMKLPFDF
jgi:hypothetical protein